MTVPVLSIIFMAVSGIIAIGLPITLFIVWFKKYDLKFLPLFVGMSAFLLFAIILEQIMHAIVLRPNEDGSIDLIKNNPALFILYGIFAAGVFEESARFISFKLLKRKFSGIGTGLSYGIGHGGIEAVLIAGLAMVSNIAASAMINTGNTAALGNDPAVLAQLGTLATTPSALFLASGFERVIAITAHISLSIFVWCSVTVKGKLWMYPAAIFMHAIINLAPAMYQAGMIESIWLVELLIAIPAALIAYGSYCVCKILRNSENEPKLAEQSEQGGE